MEKEFKIALPIIFVLIFTALLFWAASFTKSKEIISIHKNSYISFQINYQILILGIALLSLLTTFLLNKGAFLNFFSIGNINATTQKLEVFGINEGDGWLKTGLSLCFVISLATATFMFFQLKKENIDWSLLKSAWIWILLFSLTNSFAEEMIFRIGIIAPLNGLLQPTTLFFVSAILFGLPHLAGMPSGIIGATMAGVLGFVLAKSMLETNGFFWAWFIHFLQDVVIIGALYLIKNVSP